ncbi:serine protease [Ancylobacter sp. 6x-1]|uniref:Serine protease n=1 Tax=Ancylobacter crimeensis TaxID=2579147 RepID=A0ABT0DAA0_9HYPH|nr:serine protease [Ancylobacter crimeensis]MCK0196888.1 serine protease [Ancylobacter crimeensis]
MKDASRPVCFAQGAFGGGMSYRQIIAAVLAAAVLGSGLARARAEDFTPPRNKQWVMLASTQDLDTAIGIARSYRGQARVVKARNGWYAVALEPHAGTMETIRKAVDWPPLPADAMLSQGTGYIETVWRYSEVPQVTAKVGKDKPGTARMAGLEVTLTREPAQEGWTAHLIGRNASGVLFDLRQRFETAADYDSSLSILELDRSNGTPEVVFDSFSGGAHCCTTMVAVTRIPGGEWKLVPLGTIDGEGMSFEDVDNDGTAEIVRGDNRFLYTFDSYAGSMQPVLIERLNGTRVEDVTTQPAFRSRIVQDVRWMEFLAKSEPKLWRSNGFLAAWVAAKTRIGEGVEAWQRMLPLYDRSTDFGISVCTTAKPLTDCPSSEQRQLSFPEGLRRFMAEAGYGNGPIGDDAGRAALAPTSLKDARAAFLALPVERRRDIQLLLATLGHWPAVANDSFGPKLFDAIRAFQASVGREATGVMTSDDYNTLLTAASPVLRMWGLERVRHPAGNATLWVPQGLGLERRVEDGDLILKSAHYNVTVLFFQMVGVSLAGGHASMLARLGADGHVIDYSLLKPQFFAISSHRDGMSVYSRFQAIAGGIVGFSLVWPSDSDAHGERLSTVMSDLFRAENELQQRRSPPAPIVEIVHAPAAAPEPGTAPSSRRSDPAPTDAAVSGSGFFIAADSLLTNAHVVKGCTDVAVSVSGRTSPGRVAKRDAVNDLALVETSARSVTTARLRLGVRLGEDVAVFGYPLSGLLASSGNFTKGTVTATAGMGDDTRRLQISAPVQPGNSGGPLLDESGNVVGVVVAKINAVAVAAATDDIPQNVNFAIKSAIAASFLESNGVSYQSGSLGEALKPADLAEKAQSFSAFIECTPN